MFTGIVETLGIISDIKKDQENIHLTIQTNITNELNYTVHENYSVNPIAPRQILTSLRYKF